MQDFQSLRLKGKENLNKMACWEGGGSPSFKDNIKLMYCFN